MEMMTSIAAMAPLDLAALAAIVLIGLPHGALDGAIAIHLGFTRKLLHFMRFLALYIAMAGLVVGAWLLAPTACLLGFLIISMLQSLYRISASSAGYKCFVEVKDVDTRLLLIQLTQMGNDSNS